ncbi:MAG: DUF2997 domain-containing protein [Dehalococcoidia bacterium]
MSEIEFTIDPATGHLELHVKGIAGPACDDVARMAKQLLGEPGREQTTREHYLRPQVRSRTRPGGEGA